MKDYMISCGASPLNCKLFAEGPGVSTSKGKEQLSNLLVACWFYLSLRLPILHSPDMDCNILLSRIC